MRMIAIKYSGKRKDANHVLENEKVIDEKKLQEIHLAIE